MEEVFKDIEYLKGYQIGDKGTLIGPRGYKLKTYISNSGYLYKHIRAKNYTIHRLVALAFISNPNNLPCIDHINNNKTDNRVENLRWVTHKENSNNELTKNNIRLSGLHIRQKEHFTKSHILQYDMNDNLIREWSSISEINRVLGHDMTTLNACCLGNEGIISKPCLKRGYKTPKLQAYGFKWKYKDPSFLHVDPHL